MLLHTAQRPRCAASNGASRLRVGTSVLLERTGSVSEKLDVRVRLIDRALNELNNLLKVTADLCVSRLCQLAAEFLKQLWNLGLIEYRIAPRVDETQAHGAGKLWPPRGRQVCEHLPRIVNLLLRLVPLVDPCDIDAHFLAL